MKDSKSIVVGIAASAAVLIATQAAAQPAQTDQDQPNIETQSKRDIHGFRLGMTKMDAEAAGAKCEYWDRYRSCSAQKDGRLYLRFQENAESKLVWLIRYKFISGTGTDEMVRNVSDQFGQQPTTIDRPQWPSRQRELPGGMLLGTPAASWWFGDGSSMGLYVHNVGGPAPFEYELQLSSQTLARLDSEARQGS